MCAGFVLGFFLGDTKQQRQGRSTTATAVDNEKFNDSLSGSLRTSPNEFARVWMSFEVVVSIGFFVNWKGGAAVNCPGGGYLLYMRISGFQRAEGGIRMSETFPYSDSFHRRFASAHSWPTKFMSKQTIKRILWVWPKDDPQKAQNLSHW